MSTENKDGFAASMGCILMLVFLAYGLSQIYAGYIGIRLHCGTGWAVAAVIATFIFRFSLPLTIGSFFGARDVWEWHWAGALLFAAPGLAFLALMIPGVLAATVAKFRR